MADDKSTGSPDKARTGSASPPPRYLCVVGVAYRPHGDRTAPEVYREAGTVVDDLPPKSRGWLLAQKIVKEMEDEDLWDVTTPSADTGE